MVAKFAQRTIALFLILGAPGCESVAMDGIDNASFDIWCGDNPCAWKVEEGRVEPSPTWHRKAMGIRFADDPTRISQVIQVNQLSCVLLAVQGDTSGDAVLHLQVDTCNDGLDAADPNIELPDGDWKTIFREASLTPSCNEARIILEKTGTGDAVLASADLTADYFCAPNSPSSTSTEGVRLDVGEQ